MTQENSLLFVELSARLPYHVMVKVWLKDGTAEEGFLDLEHNYADVLTNAFYGGDIMDIKPYLRPMSSMTDGEKYIFDTMTRGYTVHQQASLLDWLNRHHFDYRGLIEKGLAIAVTEENNPYKE